MKKYILSISVFLCIFSLMPGNIMATDLNELKRQLKSCNDESCKSNLQQEAEGVFQAVGKNFNDNFSNISNNIVMDHSRSIIREIFYHMNKIKPYHNYKDVFLFKKLKKLKEYRDRFEQRKIDSSDFNRLKDRAENQYKHDIAESQDFIDDKVLRLRELCDNLNTNADSVQGLLDQKQDKLPNYLTSSILSLQQDKVWQDFAQNTAEGQKIRNAMLKASNDAGLELIARLEGIFSSFVSSTGGGVFPADLLNRLAEKYLN